MVDLILVRPSEGLYWPVATRDGNAGLGNQEGGIRGQYAYIYLGLLTHMISGGRISARA